jgi:hypothetical protein
MDFYHARDRALMALLYLTCGRITEALSLKKSQFVMDEDPGFIIITNMIVVKRKKKQRKAPPIRAEVPLPKEGPLAKFTKLVVEYLNVLPGDARLFEFKRRRAWQIVKYTTGKWCHYFRSQGESWYGKIYDVFGLKEFVKVTSIETLRARKLWVIMFKLLGDGTEIGCWEDNCMHCMFSEDSFIDDKYWLCYHFKGLRWERK